MHLEWAIRETGGNLDEFFITVEEMLKEITKEMQVRNIFNK